ncbi:MAG: polysulfide reductase NrfD, partial [Desulfuromusa sp.]|nr:polysulfide reductase NrfD [Desulfuromusa sp.]
MLFWTIFSIATLLSITGIAAISYQIIKDHTATNLSDRLPWGIYIESFFFFSALGSGTLLFSAIVVIFNLEEYYYLSKLSSAFSFGALVTAGIVLGADLGKPFRIIKMITNFNPSSPLTWDFYFLSACAVLNLVFIFDLFKNDFLLTLWAVVAILAALTFVMLHSLFFVSKSESGFRSQPFLALDVLVQALMGGLAVINLLLTLLGNNVDIFNKGLLILLILALAVNAGGRICVSHTGLSLFAGKSVLALSMVSLAILFFAVGFKAELTGVTILVSVLVLASVFLDKSHIVRHSQSGPVIPRPASQFDPPVLYTPSAV